MPNNPNTTEIGIANALYLAEVSYKWMEMNHLPHNEELEDLVSSFIVVCLMDYYIRHEMVYDLEKNPVDLSAVLYAFGELQQTLEEEKQAAMAMMAQRGMPS